MPVSAEATEALAVYLHWPFCRAKCPYCDFNSHVRDGVEQADWRRAYRRDIAHWAKRLPGRRAGSIFFGGGTPSLMTAETVAAVLRAIEDGLGFTDDIEITLEANPTSVEAARFADYRAAGVNRVSIGVQALDDAALAALGREHSAAEAIRAVELARATFPHHSLDLIYARPGQTVAAWRAELATVLGLAGEHLSLYQLTIEAGTAFHTAHRLGQLRLPDEDVQEALLETTWELCEAAGLPAYEISNHARSGAESRHNLAYWRGGDYVGIGPGAHGRLTLDGRRRATVAHRLPERWLGAVGERGHGLESEEILAPETAAEEALMMGLRLTDGVARARFDGQALAKLDDIVDGEGEARLIEGGFLDSTPERLRATATGRRVLNTLLAQLLA